MRNGASLALLLLLASPVFGQESVDLILHNGKLFTADAMLSMRTAVAVRGGRIVAVGDERLRTDYRAAKVIDLRGRLVVPGFIDTHIHVSGRPRRFVELSELKSIEVQKRGSRG